MKMKTWKVLRVMEKMERKLITLMWNNYYFASL
jgi:hypothetical protein